MVWACASCTLENADALNTCDVCGAAAPLASGWACGACTFANAEGAAECAMCGAAAPAAGGGGAADDALASIVAMGFTQLNAQNALSANVRVRGRSHCAPRGGRAAAWATALPGCAGR